MNYQKDTQGQQLISQRNSTGIEAFSITLSKKCERLATAIYLVTNFLSDTEPMKSRLRTLSLDFVRDASFVRYGAQATEASILDTLRANIGETLSLLELAFIAGLVSEMNFTILKREYASLRDSIDIKKASRESRTDTILGDNFFGTPESVSSPHLSPVFRTPHPRSDLTGTPEGRSSVSHPAPRTNSHPSVVSGHMSVVHPKMSDRTPKGQTQMHPASAPTHPRSDLESADSCLGHEINRGRASVSAPAPSPLSTSNQLIRGSAINTFRLSTSAMRDSRRARILKLVKDNREVAIRDIVAHFPDISEKTIQRELVSLSDSGVLKKSGERRWSRYALA